jgi:hypothetical protein
MAEVMADVPPEPAVKEEARRDRSRDRGSEDRRRDRDRRDDRDDRRRDRDRDYKRRKSGTPPAGGSYRDRRYSPRRSSPPYKRRRDDEFDGRRGGSPGDDRRYSLSDLGSVSFESELEFFVCWPLFFFRSSHVECVSFFWKARRLTHKH